MYFMSFEEIIQALLARNERVTRCFFFWTGPLLEEIQEKRKSNPTEAALMERPICNTCRPALLRVLHEVYEGKPFDYCELVSDFYCHLLEGDKLRSIKNPEKLMGWIVTAAHRFFLNQKMQKDKKQRKNNPIDYPIPHIPEHLEDDTSSRTIREFVYEVLKAMPNREYAMILNDGTLEIMQYRGKEKVEARKAFANRLGISVDYLYEKETLAKKQFKETAIKIGLNKYQYEQQK